MGNYLRLASNWYGTDCEAVMTKEDAEAILINLNMLCNDPALPFERRLAISYLMGSFCVAQSQTMEELKERAAQIDAAIYSLTIEAMRANTCPCEKCQADRNRKYH